MFDIDFGFCLFVALINTGVARIISALTPNPNNFIEIVDLVKAQTIRVSQGASKKEGLGETDTALRAIFTRFWTQQSSIF